MCEGGYVVPDEGAKYQADERISKGGDCVEACKLQDQECCSGAAQGYPRLAGIPPQEKVLNCSGCRATGRVSGYPRWVQRCLDWARRWREGGQGAWSLEGTQCIACRRPLAVRLQDQGLRADVESAGIDRGPGARSKIGQHLGKLCGHTCRQFAYSAYS